MVSRWFQGQPDGWNLLPMIFLQLVLLFPLISSSAIPKSIDGHSVLEPFGDSRDPYTNFHINPSHLQVLLTTRVMPPAFNEDFLRVSIPPILEEGPPKGELMFHVIHDPTQVPENLTIPCRADALPIPSYSWFKDGQHFSTEERNVVVVDGEGTLVFVNPQPEDEGDYQCVATNSAGSVFSDIVNVRRAVTISFPKGEPRVVTATVGEPLALKCENPGGYPVPSLHWVLQRSDGSLRSVSSERATVDSEGTLWFGSLTREDASIDALYACAASSATSEREIFIVEESGTLTLEDTEPEEGEYYSLNLQETLIRLLDLSGRTEYRMGNWVYLNVTTPPDSSNTTKTETEPFLQYVSNSDFTALEGEDMKLFCIYGGNPIPKVTWWREDGNSIPEQNIKEFGKALQFPEVSSQQEGTYKCQASSPAGHGPVHSFRINIDSLPVFIEKPATVNQPIGESATFRCVAKGNPEPTIIWSINGEPLQNSHDQTQLSFPSLTINNKGVIACNASNLHGYVYATGFLNVLSLPPEFTIEPEDTSAFVGESVTLPCEGYGAPDPQMVWVKVLGSGTEQKISQHDERYTLSKKSLVIKSLSDKTKGKYRCTAVNKYGSVTTSIAVKMIMSTTVKVSGSANVTKAGETITIRCDVSIDDNLDADVTWMKNDVPLDFSSARITSGKGGDDDDDRDDSYDRLLTIKKSRGSDSGVYSCISRTRIDEAEGYFIVFVEDVPNPPEIEEIECSKREAYIHWSYKRENSSPISGYIIQSQTELHKDKWIDSENDIPSMKTSFSVKLSPGLTHVFRVIALNRVGASEPSTPSEPCIAEGAPPDYNPTNTSVKIIDSSTLLVLWKAIEPIEHNGPDFRYEVSWKHVPEAPSVPRQDKSEKETHPEQHDAWSKLVIEDWEQTEAEIDGLQPHTQYRIRVAAINAHGSAPSPKETLVFTEAAVPEAPPSALRVRRVMATTAILFWIPVPSHQVLGPLKGYQIDIWRANEDKDKDGRDDEDKRDDDDLIVLGQKSRAELTGLEPFTEYEARVRVLNQKFSGPYTDPIRFRTTAGESSPVVDLKARSVSSSDLIVEWDPPEEPQGVITSYLVQYQPVYADGAQTGPVETTTTADEMQVKLSELEENTLYKITVFPKNKRGLGVSSEVKALTETTESSLPVPPVFIIDVVKNMTSATTSRTIIDRDNDDDIDEKDVKFQNVILADVDGDGDIDEKDILDTDGDGDIDDNDFNVADINNDGVVDEKDVLAADRDGDGDVDEYDVGDEDGNGIFDARDVVIADEDGDGDIDAKDDNDENVILQDFDGDGDIDEDDAIDVDEDGDIDEADLAVLDIDNDGDVDGDDVKIADKDGDGDVDAADVVDLDEDGRIDDEDLSVRDKNGDGEVDRSDYIYRATFVADTDGDGDVDRDDVLDSDGDGDIDKKDFDVADINNDGSVDEKDISAADRDGDGDVDANDIGDEDGDGDVDGADVIIADEDRDGDIDAKDDDEEGTILEDVDGDGNIDKDDVRDVNLDGVVDENDVAILDVNDDGKIDFKDLRIIDKDGDGDVDSADVVDFDGDGAVDKDDLAVIDRDGDGDVDAKDVANQHVYLKDVDKDGDIDENDVLDIDQDGDVDKDDFNEADLDDDGDVDADDVSAFDKNGDREIDENDITDVDRDGRIDEDDFNVKDRDGDGDVDERDYNIRNVFLTDADGDGDIDVDDVLDSDGDGDVDKNDINVADINNDGKVDIKDIKAADRDGDGDVDIADIGDEDGDGDVDGKDVIAADKDRDGDIDAADDNGKSILLFDKDRDGDIDEKDVSDVNGDGDTDETDYKAMDIDNDGDVDRDDLLRGDKDGDGDIDAADITDLDADGDVDGNDVIISDRDGDGDIDKYDRRNKDVILGDADGDGDIDSEDVLDTDWDGDIDGMDFAAADINNDGHITIDDVIAADQDGDGDVDSDDIGDVDGDGDVDAQDVKLSDKDEDGDIDRADKGDGVDVVVKWRPDLEKNPGSEFYIKYRPVGDEVWRKSPVEENSLHQKVRGLDPYTAYEIQMVAKDGEFESPSNVSVIGPFAQSPVEEPTVGAVMDEADPMLMTWFIVAVIVAVTMICGVIFSVWVYNQRLSRVSELRAQLYEGYEPPTVVEKKPVDVEAPPPEDEKSETEEPLTAEKHRQQMSALLKRQETIQSVDSFASHDDDFAEYGDETMTLDLLSSVSLITNPQRQGQPTNAYNAQELYLTKMDH